MAMNAAEGRRMLEAARQAPNLVTQLVPGAAHARGRPDAQAARSPRATWARCRRSSCTRRRAGSSDAEAPLHWRQDVTLSGHNVLNMGIWYEAMMRWLGPGASG